MKVVAGHRTLPRYVCVCVCVWCLAHPPHTHTQTPPGCPPPPAATVNPTPCGNATVYCPAGSVTPLAVQGGYYSAPATGVVTAATDIMAQQLDCPAGCAVYFPLPALPPRCPPFLSSSACAPTRLIHAWNSLLLSLPLEQVLLH
jgi:hypothetical protein